MPIGPNGERRPSDVIANAVALCRIASGEAEEEYADPVKRRAGQAGGKARTASVPPERRREIARQAAAARWGGE